MSTGATTKRGVLTSVLSALVVLTSACGSEDKESESSRSKVTESTVAVRPSGTTTDRQIVVWVNGVSEKSGRLHVEARIANTRSVDTSLTSPTVKGAGGEVLRGSKTPIQVPAGSVNNVDIEFEGALEKSETFDISFERSLSGLVVKGVAFDKKKAVEYSVATPAAEALTDSVGRHPNGTSLMIYTIATTADGVSVTFKALNGSSQRTTLWSSSDPPIFVDNKGGKLVGVTQSPEAFDVNPYGRVSGTINLVGILSPGATSGSFSLNPHSWFADKNSTIPRIEVTNLPVPGAKS